MAVTVLTDPAYADDPRNPGRGALFSVVSSVAKVDGNTIDVNDEKQYEVTDGVAQDARLGEQGINEDVDARVLAVFQDIPIPAGP